MQLRSVNTTYSINNFSEIVNANDKKKVYIGRKYNVLTRKIMWLEEGTIVKICLCIMFFISK